MYNLLLIYTGEQRFDTLAAWGNRRIHMPKLNRLAERSTVFQRTYCNQPVRTPSRGSIVSGLWPHTHGCTVNNTSLGPEHLCLPEMLPTGRYACGHFGKWHLGNEIFPQHGFADWRATEDTYHMTYGPPHKEFDPVRSTYHHCLVERGVKPNDISSKLPPEKRHPAFEDRFFREQIHAFPEDLSRPSFLADQSIQFIGEHRAHPWVLYVNFLEPRIAQLRSRIDAWQQRTGDTLRLPATAYEGNPAPVPASRKAPR